MPAHIKFLGGADEVGSLSMLLEDGSQSFLFDYGMSPSDPPRFPAEAPPVDHALLSHAHIDHSGMISWLCGKYQTPVMTTSITAMITEILSLDSLKISKFEDHYLPFDDNDISTFLDCIDPVEYGIKRSHGDYTITPLSAGHIPGSTMFLLEGEKRILFTGDLNTIDTRLVEGTSPVDCDILILESTYAGRSHDLRQKIEYSFLEKVEDVVTRGGLAVIPVFAVGRCQEILLMLKDTGYNIWLDGMGSRVTQTFLKEPEFLRDSKALKSAYRQVNIVRSQASRRKALKGEVIVTTSGMLDGGPVIEYVSKIKDDPDSAILITGYQVEGTNGRLLLDEGTMNIAGIKEKINCQVEAYDFSAHAGHDELLKFIERCDPEEVILCHGEQRESLAQDLKEQYSFHTPANLETILL